MLMKDPEESVRFDSEPEYYGSLVCFKGPQIIKGRAVEKSFVYFPAGQFQSN